MMRRLLLMVGILGWGLCAGEKRGEIAHERIAQLAQKHTTTYAVTAVSDFSQLTPTQAANQLLPKDSPLRVRWALPIRDCQVKRIILPPTQSDLKYFLIETTNYDLIAIRSDNGEPLWWVKAHDFIFGDIAFGEQSLYYIIGNRLICLDRMNGNVIWNTELPFAPSASPAVNETERAGAQIFIPSMARKIHCISVKEEIWPDAKTPILDGGFTTMLTSVTELWQYAVSGLIESAMTYNTNGWLFASSYGKRLYGIELDDSVVARGAPDDSKIWQESTRGATTTLPICDGPNVLFASRDQYLYCISRDSGVLVWNYITEYPLTVSPQILADEATNRTYIIQRVGNAGLLCLSNRNGIVQWKLENGVKIVGVLNDDNRDKSLQLLAICVDAQGDLTAIYPAATDARTPAEKQTDDANQRYRQIRTAWKIATADKFKTFADNTAISGEFNYGFIFCTTADGGTVCVLERNR